MNWRIDQGDVMARLREMPDASVHCVITSPPYFGLRSYGTGTWEGGDTNCDHKHGRFERGGLSSKQASNSGSAGDEAQGICPKCGARRVDQQIGLEPTLEGYVAKLVEVFSEVRRVLRPDGMLALNLGDSYASAPVGSFNGGTALFAGRDLTGHESSGTVNKVIASGLKPKDLMLVPFRVVLALQDSGWWVRSCMPWVKRSAMPESVTDRPTSAVEYVFLLSQSGESQFWTHPTFDGTRDRPKPDYRWRHNRTQEETDVEPEGWRDLKEDGRKVWSRRNLWQGHDYFCDMDAVRREYSPSTFVRVNQPSFDSQTGGDKDYGGNRSSRKALENLKQNTTGLRRYEGFNGRWDEREASGEIPQAGRNFRNSDLWFESVEGGLVGSGDELVGLDVNPQALSLAHFAAYPEKLVLPLVRMATSEKGCCPVCGAQWVRVVERGLTAHDGETESLYPDGSTANRLALLRQAARKRGEEYANGTTTLGFRPSCSHEAEPIPSTVLDPFAGSGTTGLVALREGRSFVGIELNAAYVAMARKRIIEDAPLLNSVSENREGASQERLA